ncbi:MAG: AAA family ATPase [Desulfamplus sp.]|nr:AAA family ATPase [Desulfamplus sp.]
MKKLPIGIQSFKKIRQTLEEFYYVDKTMFIEHLLKGGGYYFLSRPRRFGKSLFLDTLRQFFLGKREFFQGLYIEDKWDWQRTYPVIYISFGAGVIRNLAELKNSFESLLIDLKNDYGFSYEKSDIKDRFFEAIVKISKQSLSNQVVILIDEYDKPILDRIEDKEVAIEIREELKNFYSVIKEADQYLKFVFITGVSRFSKVSLFSGLNNLNDISLDSRYATLYGYTQKELESVFRDRVCNFDKATMDRVKQWYNGYRWLGESVYNPFDILLYFDKKEFRPYWFETGTPSFLINLMIKNQYFIPLAEDMELGDELIGAIDIDHIFIENLLFQTGYLTIKDRISLDGDGIMRYRLGYPNLEVKYSLTNVLLNSLVADYQKKERNKTSFYKAFTQGNLEELKSIFYSFFASIPHDWYRKNQISGYEGYYATIFYCYFTACGFEVKAEDATNHGKIDMAVFYKNRCCLFEFKVIELIAKGKAIDQLKKKKYQEKYLHKYEEIALIGVEFSKESRNIERFEIEWVR